MYRVLKEKDVLLMKFIFATLCYSPVPVLFLISLYSEILGEIMPQVRVFIIIIEFCTSYGDY